jgi:hypothetical protein
MIWYCMKGLIGRQRKSYCSAISEGAYYCEYFTLYIDGMVFFNNLRPLRYNGKGESVFHLMSKNMFCRLDPLLNALLYNSYGIVNRLIEGRVCMCKVDSSKACIRNDYP